MTGFYLSRRWDPFNDFQREVGRLFGRFEPVAAGRNSRPFPAVNLYEADEKYVLTAEVPGADTEKLEVSLVGENLLLRGERIKPEGVSDESYRRRERPFGKWSRNVTLPDRVEGSKVTAHYANGVLTVTIPKAEDARPRQIAVTTTP